MKDTNTALEAVESNNELCDKRNEKRLKIRNVAAQIIITVAVNLVKFSHGNFIGLNTLMIAELSQENSEIEVTKDELTWFGSFYFMSPVGALFIGLLGEHVGSRMLILITSVMLSASSLIIYLATNSTMLSISQILVGLMFASTFGSSVTYIAEIAQPNIRSSLIASGHLCFSLGVTLILLMAKFFNWRTIAIINLMFPVMGFLGMLFAPNSPYWLTRKERLNDAEAALAWLRGWTSLDDVRSEFLTLKETYLEEKDNEIKKDKRSVCAIIKPYMQKSLWIPMCYVFYILLMHTLCGSECIHTYILIILRMNEVPIDIYVAAAIITAVTILGGFVCMLSIHKFGKRKLMFISLIGAGFAFVVIAVLIHLIKLEIVKSTDGYFWIPFILLLIFSSFSTSVGIGRISYMYTSELLPNRFREVGVGISRFVDSTSSSMLNKSFLYMVDAMTMQGVFLFFGINCIFALVTLYFIVPETEGKTLIEIENQLTNKKPVAN